MIRAGTTLRQNEALRFIRGYVAEHGASPSHGQIAEALGLRSKSAITRLLACLEERGHVERIPGRHRSVVPTDRWNAYVLPPKVQDALRAYCRAHDEDPEAFVSDAVLMLLDARELDLQMEQVARETDTQEEAAL